VIARVSLSVVRGAPQASARTPRPTEGVDASSSSAIPLTSCAPRSMLASARRSVSAPAMLRHFRSRRPRRPLAGCGFSQRVAASRDIATRNRKIAA